MKLATLCFNLNSKFNGETPTKIISILALKKPTFLLCSGYSLSNNKQLKDLSAWLSKQTFRCSVLVEVKNDNQFLNKPNPGDLITNTKEPRKHCMFLVSSDGKLKTLGYQPFGESKELNKKKTEPQLIKLLEDQIPNRSFSVGQVRCFSLCCGEINFLTGNNKVPIKIRSKKLAKAVLKADLILNPIHDRMANPYGAFSAKAKFLSKRIGTRNRAYIYSANWNPAKGQNGPTPTNQRMFLNGEKVTTILRELIEGDALYAEFDYPIA